MLVLSRNLYEAIEIGGNIRVTVVYIRDGRVKLGIEAPDGVTVYRQEIADRIRQNERDVKARSG